MSLRPGQRLGPYEILSAPWKALRPDDGAGVFLVDSFQVTGVGEAYAYSSYQRFLQDLFLVRGVR